MIVKIEHKMLCAYIQAHIHSCDEVNRMFDRFSESEKKG